MWKIYAIGAFCQLWCHLQPGKNIQAPLAIHQSEWMSWFEREPMHCLTNRHWKQTRLRVPVPVA
jgi:hypothetical protein